MADLGVFICYRRSDASAEAGRLYEALRRRYGRDHLFMDVGIVPGDDWVDAIERAVSGCDVLLAVIGREWLAATDEQGRPRLTQDYDRVRLEIEAALRQGKPVVPVLVEEASMPDDHELPESLRALHRRQAIRVSHATFQRDFAELMRALRMIERKKPVAPAAPEPATSPLESAALAPPRPAPDGAWDARPPATLPALLASLRTMPLTAVLGGVAVVTLIAAAYIGASLAARAPSHSPGPTGPIGATDTKEELLGHVAPSLRAGCTEIDAGNAIVVVECPSGDSLYVKYAGYGDVGALGAEFENWVASIDGEPTEGGDCSDTSSWPVMDNTLVGRELCGNYGDPHILWTHERYLIFGRAWGYTGADNLFTFYRDVAGQLTE